MKRRLLPILFILTLVCAAAFNDAGSARAANPSHDHCYSTAWPHETSALLPDPDLYFGRLDNGFRYVLMKNEEPRDRVGIYLNVEAGSLHERDSERGLAHFLEHMLFNGTSHFPAGELIDFFQSIGMDFGADVNGYTTYTDTVYKLLLPSGSKESLEQGLLVMRDYADGALLLEEEIERERGIIMAEKAARDSAAYRSSMARTAFIFKNTPLPQRPPIGDTTVLETADREDLLAYYQRWYRPDNMILIAVGDFNRREAEELIIEHFDSLRSKAEGECPDYGSTSFSGTQTFYHYEPELGATDVIIETIANETVEHDSLKLQQEEIVAQLVSMIINQRLSKLREGVDTAFISAHYYDSLMLNRFRIAGIRARTDREGWRESLIQLDEVLRQVLQYGFYNDEVERVKKDVLADLKNRAAAAETRSSIRLIRKIINHLDANSVMQSPEQELKLYGPFIENIGAADLHQAVRKRWVEKARIVQLIGDARLDGSRANSELLSAYEAAGSRALEPPERIAQVTFPYLTASGSSAEPIRTVNYEEIDVRRADFRHGLIVNTKVTDFKNNEVQVALHFGDGLRSLPKNGLDRLAAALINESGTATLEKSELSAALAGTSVRYWFRVGPESFVLEGRAVRDDIELLFTVLHALLNDPGFRPSVYQVSMKNFEAMYQRLRQSIEGGATLFLPPFFTGDALGAGLPPRDEFMSLKIDEVVSWLEPYLERAPLELSLVGDFEVQQVERLASKYFDGPEPRKYQPVHRLRADFPRGRHEAFTVDTSIDKTLVRFGWLTDDFSDIERTRRLNILSALLEDRLRREIREELGVVYSPSAYNIPSRIYPGYGVLYAEMIVDQHLVDVVLRAVRRIERSFGDEPISVNELQRAREPIVTLLKDSIRGNAYWLNTVLSLSSRNEDQLDWPLQMISDYQSVEITEINDLARFYLTRDRRASALIKSEAAGDQS